MIYVLLKDYDRLVVYDQPIFSFSEYQDPGVGTLIAWCGLSLGSEIYFSLYPCTLKGANKISRLYLENLHNPFLRLSTLIA